LLERPELNESNVRALELWRLLGRRIDWPNLLIVCEVYAVPIDDELVHSLQMLAEELGT
jgi:hypothetical protein